MVNPSFEITTTNCSNPLGEFFEDIVDWDQANVPGADSCSTADFFSACNLSLFGNGGPTAMPNSQLGFQYSRTGTRHIGIITHEPGSEWREYAQGRTSAPLVAGQSYCVSLYVSLANACLFATDNIGIRFYQNHFQRNACPGTTNSLINVTPHLNYDCSAITDTMGWTRIQWNYVASGGEQYFIIGNFFNNANTTIANFPGGGGGGLSLPMPMAYYYIDDVSIEPNGCCYVDFDTTGTTAFCVTDPSVTLTTIAGLEGNCTPAGLVGFWSGPGITDQLAGTFDPGQAGVGTHTITYTLPCGYVATRQIIVSPCVPLSVCQLNGNLTVSNGVGPYNWQSQVTTQDCSTCLPAFPPFVQPCALPPGCAVTVTSWQTFATGPTIPAPGSFPIQVVDAYGTTFIINNPASLPACAACPPITVTPGNVTHVSCFGDNDGSATVSVSGGVTPYTITWQPGNLTGTTQNALAAGTYTITVTDDNSCVGDTTVTITQPTAIVLQTASTPADCGASNGQATVTASGGMPNYTYAWSPSGGNASIANNLAAGNYTITVTDANGCDASGQVVVANSNGPVISLVSQTDVTCHGGNNGSAEISISQGTAPYDVAWSPSGGTATTASDLTAGTYTVTVTDDADCIATQSVTIGEPAVIQSSVSSTSANCGFSDGVATVVVQGGTPPYAYAWSPSGGNGATTAPIPTGNYTVTITDAAGCESEVQVFVDVIVLDSTLSLSVISTPESCAGNDGTATVAASGGNPPYSYLWDGGDMPDSSFTGGLAAGAYTVTVTDQCYSLTQQVTVDKDFSVPPASLPNIITPNGDGVNDAYDLGSQFESTEDFYCVIYNRWGVAVHKTDNKAIIWKPKNITDGTYFILVSYTDCTGKEEKLTSTITVAGSKY